MTEFPVKTNYVSKLKVNSSNKALYPTSLSADLFVSFH